MLRNALDLQSGGIAVSAEIAFYSPENVIAVAHDVRCVADEFTLLQSQYLAEQLEPKVEQMRLETEMLAKTRRVYTLAKRVAKPFVPETVAIKAA